MPNVAMSAMVKARTEQLIKNPGSTSKSIFADVDIENIRKTNKLNKEKTLHIIVSKTQVYIKTNVKYILLTGIC